MDTIKPEVQRDRYGRPLIIPPGGGKPVAYQRCTRYVDVLQDRYNLERWSQRRVAVGVAIRDDLRMRLASLAADQDAHKAEIDKIAAEAADTAGASSKATLGTTIHRYAELINLNLPVGHVPPELEPHVAAYREAVAGMATIGAETFLVQDDLRVGGTADLIATIPGEDGAFICDLKTGPATLKYGALKVAMQLAVYAHSRLYNPETGMRVDVDGLRTDKGLVIALNADTAETTKVWIDLEAGWGAVQTARQVHTWRARRDLLQPYGEPQPTVVTSSAIMIHASLIKRIREATTASELRHLWADNKHDWDDELTELAALRVTELQQ